MIEMQEDQIPSQLMSTDIQAVITRADYVVLPNSTTTVCQLTLKNGYTVTGTSACVDPTKFNTAMGEKYAYEKAFDKVWELEGYLLRQRRFEAGLA